MTETGERSRTQRYEKGEDEGRGFVEVGVSCQRQAEWVASACASSNCHLQGLCNFRKYV